MPEPNNAVTIEELERQCSDAHKHLCKCREALAVAKAPDAPDYYQDIVAAHIEVWGSAPMPWQNWGETERRFKDIFVSRLRARYAPQERDENEVDRLRDDIKRLNEIIAELRKRHRELREHVLAWPEVQQRTFTVKDGQMLDACRICHTKSGVINPGNGNSFKLNFGKEFAHSQCLETPQEPVASRSAVDVDKAAEESQRIGRNAAHKAVMALFNNKADAGLVLRYMGVDLPISCEAAFEKMWPVIAATLRECLATAEPAQAPFDRELRALREKYEYRVISITVQDLVANRVYRVHVDGEVIVKEDTLAAAMRHFIPDWQEGAGT